MDRRGVSWSANRRGDHWKTGGAPSRPGFVNILSRQVRWGVGAEGVEDASQGISNRIKGTSRGTLHCTAVSLQVVVFPIRFWSSTSEQFREDICIFSRSKSGSSVEGSCIVPLSEGGG